MPDLNLTRVNGTPYSWTSCANFFNGLPYKGITGVTFKDSREVKLVHAGRQDGLPLGMTSGVYKVENVSFTLLRESATGLMTDLTALGLGSFGDASFLYTLQVFEPDFTAIPPMVPLTTSLIGCRITGVEDKQEMGVDELVTEFTCQALAIVRTAGPLPLTLYSQIRSLLP